MVLAAVSVFTGSDAARKRILVLKGVPGSATCVNQGRDKNNSITQIYQFTPENGEPVRFLRRCGQFPAVPIGGQIDIVYDPGKPKRVELVKDMRSKGLQTVLFWVFSAALVASLAGLVITRSP
ncbi:hypothetical protein ACWGQ5_17415 [Streptomyces sp. NPDC055722]